MRGALRWCEGALLWWPLVSVLGEMAPGGLIRFFFRTCSLFRENLSSSDGVTSYSVFYSQPRGSCLQRTQSRETHGFTLQLYPLCAVEKKFGEFASEWKGCRQVCFLLNSVLSLQLRASCLQRTQFQKTVRFMLH